MKTNNNECKCKNCDHAHHCGTPCWDCVNDVCTNCKCEHCSDENK